MKKKNPRATPRNKEKLLKSLIKRVDDCCAYSEALTAFTSNLSDDTYDALSDTFGSTEEPNVDLSYFNSLAYYLKRMCGYLSNMSDALKSTVEHGEEFLHYVEDYYSYIDELRPLNEKEEETLIALLIHRDNVIRIYKKEAEKYPEITRNLSREKLELVLDIPYAFDEIYAVYADIQNAVKNIKYQSKSSLKRTEKHEVLFHASVEAGRLLKEGFNVAGPKSAKGLGQYFSVKEWTAFTSSEWLAAEISKVLYDLVLIANGFKSAEDILKLAKSSGAFEYWKELFWGRQTEKKVLEADRAGLLYAYSKLLPALQFTDKDTYIDPVVCSADKLAPKLEGIDPRGVGAIACKVDMTSEKMEVVEGMDEYRIPASQVISCVGVYFPAEEDGGYLGI